jgi:hypothetical protein
MKVPASAITRWRKTGVVEPGYWPDLEKLFGVWQRRQQDCTSTLCSERAYAPVRVCR